MISFKYSEMRSSKASIETRNLMALTIVCFLKLDKF